MKKNNYNRRFTKKNIITIINNIIIILVISKCFVQQVSYAKQTTAMEFKPILVFDNRNLDPKDPPKGYRHGLNLQPKLYASASAQPNTADLKYIISMAKANLPKQGRSKVFIVDLRQEPHVFVNNYAVSWYGIQNRVPYSLEENLLAELTNAKTIKIYTKLKKLAMGRSIAKNFEIVTPGTVATEKTIVEELGANYVRLLVMDHLAPNDQEVDLFIELVKSLPKNSWLHFHCRGGKGRSTTFMAMLDLIRNAPNLTLEQIIKRQHLIGGIKLSKFSSKSLQKKWKAGAALKRYAFIKNFYHYVVDPNGYKKITWSKWAKDE